MEGGLHTHIPTQNGATLEDRYLSLIRTTKYQNTGIMYRSYDWLTRDRYRRLPQQAQNAGVAGCLVGVAATMRLVAGSNARKNGTSHCAFVSSMECALFNLGGRPRKLPPVSAARSGQPPSIKSSLATWKHSRFSENAMAICSFLRNSRYCHKRMQAERVNSGRRRCMAYDLAKL